MPLFTCEFYLCSLKLRCYLLSRLFFQQGFTYYMGKECISSGWQPQPQGGWYNMQCSHGMIKRRIGVIYLPQRAEVEGTNFLCLTHSLCFCLAEQSGWGCFQRCFSSLGHRAMASPKWFAQSPELQNLSSSSWMALGFQQILKGIGLNTGSFLWPDLIILKAPT